MTRSRLAVLAVLLAAGLGLPGCGADEHGAGRRDKPFNRVVLALDASGSFKGRPW